MNPQDNNSTRKLQIVKRRKPDGSSWIEVLLLRFAKHGEVIPCFQPSFLDLFRIVRAICDCEDEKYPPPQFQGRYKVLDFLRDAIMARSDDDFNALALKYRIPERAGGEVIATNGAKLKDGDPAGVPLTAADIRW